MSWIGDMLNAGIEADGSKLQMNNAFGLKSEDITGADTTALSVAIPVSFLTTASGGGAFTIADGQYTGQVKIIAVKLKVTDDAVVVGTFGEGTDLTLSATGEGVVLIFDGTSWQVVGNNAGAVT